MARRSTWVEPQGTQITTRGVAAKRLLVTFLMKFFSIFSVTSKSAITPSFIGRMAWMLPGVRPSIFFASVPTASTALRPVFGSICMATTEGSSKTMPLDLV